MLNWHVANEMTPDFGAVLLILNLVCVAVFLGILYVHNIETCVSLALKRLYLFVRFRHWGPESHARN